MSSTPEENIKKIADDLSQLSVSDMSKLKTILEESWGVKAAVATAAVASTSAEAAAPAAESTEFKVILESVPADKKISVIKEIRPITGLGLKEAKDLVEGAPKELKASCPKAEAEEIKKKVEAAGGKVSLQGL